MAAVTINPAKFHLGPVKLEPLKKQFATQWEPLLPGLAGFSGGMASAVCLHPLDLIKVRLAVHDGKTSTRPEYKGIVNAFSTILREEGVRGLYRGVTPCTAGLSWGIFFLVYNTIKKCLQDGNTQKEITSTQHMMAAAGAGILNLFLTNPMSVGKTRLCLQYGNKILPGTQVVHRYTGMIDVLLHISKYEGVRGMYKGLSGGLFGVVHGTLQFMAYEKLKESYNKYWELPQNKKLTKADYILCAAFSKVIAAIPTYPFHQVVKVRLQDHSTAHKTATEVIWNTFRQEGIKGFYKGFTAHLLHVTPNIVIVFFIYEQVAGSYSK